MSLLNLFNTKALEIQRRLSQKEGREGTARISLMRSKYCFGELLKRQARPRPCTRGLQWQSTSVLREMTSLLPNHEEA